MQAIAPDMIDIAETILKQKSFVRFCKSRGGTAGGVTVPGVIVSTR